MNTIAHIVEIITKQVKSKRQARAIAAQFLKNNDEETNRQFIVHFRKATRKNKSGRIRHKIAEVEEEIMDYLCEHFSTESYDEEQFAEYVGEYEYILQGEIQSVRESEGEIPLAFIPHFYPHPQALITAYNLGCTTLEELAHSPFETWRIIFENTDELLDEIAILMQALGIKTAVPRA